MAWIQCRFFSDVLGFGTAMNVILPQQVQHQIGLQGSVQKKHYPTLFLLHGMSDDDTAWIRYTSIERYAAALGLAVVMPQVHRSCYSDMVYGGRYWTFLSEELPQLARAFFPLSPLREHNYVAGLSMGGYGALKWAFRRPDQFAAVASLSGGLDRTRMRGHAAGERDYQLAFGGRDIKGTEDDVYWLIGQLKASDKPKPIIYQCCGTEDPFYEDNVKFRDICVSMGIDLTYEEEQGSHEWSYWDKKIQDVLAWLPLP